VNTTKYKQYAINLKQ